MSGAALTLDRTSVCCGFPPGRLRDDIGACVRRIETGAECRDAMLHEPASSSVVVSSGTPDVAPINLAAALKSDSPMRDVYLECEEISGSLASRMDAAGVKGPVSLAEIETALRALDGKREEALQETAPLAEGALAPVGSDVAAEAGDDLLVWSFVSGRGGVGKSVASVLFALCAWEQGKRVILIDMDAQFGDLRYICGNDGTFTMIGMGEDGSYDTAALAQCPRGSIALVHSLAGPEYAQSIEGRFASVLSAARRFDIAIVNTGSNWTDSHGDIAALSDAVIFLMDQRPTSVQGCKEAADLCVRMGIPTSKLMFMLNRCSGRDGISTYDCALALGVPNVMELQDGGSEVEEAMSMGIPSSLLMSGNALIASVGEAYAEVAKGFGLQVTQKAAKQKRAPLLRFGFGMGRRKEGLDDAAR